MEVSLAGVEAAGERCVEKVEEVEEIEYEEVERCDHSYDKKCHTTYQTEYDTQQEEECDDNFHKTCEVRDPETVQSDLYLLPSDHLLAPRHQRHGGRLHDAPRQGQSQGQRVYR